MTQNFLRRPPSPKKGPSRAKTFLQYFRPIGQENGQWPGQNTRRNSARLGQLNHVPGQVTLLSMSRHPTRPPSLDKQTQEISLLSDKGRESYKRRRYVSTVIGRRLRKPSRLTSREARLPQLTPYRVSSSGWPVDGSAIAESSTLSERRRTRAVTPVDSGCDTNRRSANPAVAADGSGPE
jgi:hypothetical protein